MRNECEVAGFLHICSRFDGCTCVANVTLKLGIKWQSELCARTATAPTMAMTTTPATARTAKAVVCQPDDSNENDDFDDFAFTAASSTHSTLFSAACL